MSMALTVIFKEVNGKESRPITPNLGGGSYGYELARSLGALDQLTADLGCRGLTTFVYEPQEFYHEILEEAEGVMDEATIEGLLLRLKAAEKQEDWHEPGEARESIRRLIHHLRNHPEIAGTEFILEALIWDLLTVEGFLIKATAEGRRFRFEIL
jgi:hypothetical protein